MIPARLIPDYGDISEPEVRAKYGYLEGFVSMAGNIGLFAIKFVLGTAIGSIALLADSFHTLSDIWTSFLLIIGFKFSKKGPDDRHPFGHGRIEFIAGLIIAISLVIMGTGFVYRSIEKIIHPAPVRGNIFIVLLLIFFSLIKEGIAQFSISLGKKIDSPTLLADAWHHRSDAITTVLVAIAILGSMYGYPILDPFFGIAVACLVIYIGIDLAKKSADRIIGEAPGEEMIGAIRKLAIEVEGVKGAHNISVHDYGDYKVATLHLEVGDMDIKRAHDIASVVEDKIKKEMNISTIVHLEPYEK
ncbi:MAG: cation diffusion facilitator family transporter [Candidatus Thermoplasmatota archaeon]|nr:cation diffusion facilitator family transporter [Candidatus Thermoplasmatota archaeon]